MKLNEINLEPTYIIKTKDPVRFINAYKKTEHHRDYPKTTMFANKGNVEVYDKSGSVDVLDQLIDKFGGEYLK